MEDYSGLVEKKINAITRHGEKYDAVVVAIDYEKGITIDTIEPERLTTLGYSFPADNHMSCLNKEAFSGREEDYPKQFAFVIDMIKAGTYDARKTVEIFYPESNDTLGMTTCAFK